MEQSKNVLKIAVCVIVMALAIVIGLAVPHQTNTASKIDFIDPDGFFFHNAAPWKLTENEVSKMGATKKVVTNNVSDYRIEHVKFCGLDATAYFEFVNECLDSFYYIAFVPNNCDINAFITKVQAAYEILKNKYGDQRGTVLYPDNAFKDCTFDILLSDVKSHKAASRDYSFDFITNTLSINLDILICNEYNPYVIRLSVVNNKSIETVQ